MRTRLLHGLPAIASPPRADSPPPSRRPAATPIRPSHGGKFVKTSKVILESPDSQAEGPFYDTDTVNVPEDSPHTP